MTPPRIRFDRRRRWPRVALVCGMAAAGSLAAILWIGRHGKPATPAATARAPWGPSPFAAGDAASRGSATVGPAAPGAPVAPAPSTANAEAESLQAKVDSLLRRGTPADAYAAYLVLRACSRARQLESMGRAQQPAAPVTCADLAPDQLLAEPTLLRTAAVAGVRGAVWSFVADGADGKGTVPRGTAAELADPAAAAYFAAARTYLEAAARQGDRVALTSLSIQAHHEDGDVAKALTYWVAQVAISLRQGEAPNPVHDDVVRHLASTLPPGDAAAAKASGLQLAAATTDAPCSPCAAAAEPSIPNLELMQRIRERVAALPQVPDAALAGEAPPLRRVAAPFAPNDIVTYCVGERCQSASYQVTGAWLPVPPADRSPPQGRP